MKNKKNANVLTAEEHFAELKKRILFIVGIILILFAICLWKSNSILALFLKQGKDAGYTMVALSPQEALLQQLRVSFTFGFLVSLPVLLYEIVVFVTPAIDTSYKIKFWFTVVAGALLFILGVCFATYLLFPFVLKYMKDISNVADIALNISVENYISFFLTLVIIIGLVFEIPIVSLIMSNLGIITSKGMKKYKKIIIVAIFVLAAIITPPDIVSQLMVAVPMIILYEISIFLCGIVEKGRDKKCE